MSICTEISRLEEELHARRELTLEEVDNHGKGLLQVLLKLSDLGNREIKSLEHFFDSAKNLSSKKKRNVSIALTRYLSEQSINKFLENRKDFARKFTELFTTALPDFCKTFDINKKQQTFELMQCVVGIHSHITKELEILGVLRPEISSILANRTEILRTLSNNTTKSYIALFAPEGCVEKIREILSELEHLDGESGDEIYDRSNNLEILLDGEKSRCKNLSTFFIRDYYINFLTNCSEAIKTFNNSSIERFRCELNFTKQSNFLAEKSYPLKEEGRELVINIPFENKGPGNALNVKVTVSDHDSGIAVNPHYHMGDLAPGRHYLALEGIVTKGCDRAEFEIDIDYMESFSSGIKTLKRLCILKAQNDTIDWDGLSRRTPYSTEVAEGKEFVGRNRSVIQLSSRCLKETMQSSYIFGQKRIGKTSLAKAVLSEIQSKSSDTKTHYVEWGEISSPDAEKTINELGDNISEFLVSGIADGKETDRLKFEGSLVPLNKLANRLLRLKPNERYVIVLDEFDEIQPELYRIGKFADPFFANLRTLSSKKNMCFILIGGESMPFIINAQGDQLNKYVPESLDFFSREELSTDYKQLIVRPVDESINWMDDAITYLFELTNGHPYYTKLICDEAFERAVENRDTDITKRDLESWVGRLVERLDVNSFSHLWVDGIQTKTPGDRELTIEKRQRVLVALGKSLQTKGKTTIEAISKHIPHQRVLDSELSEFLKEFESREILFTEGFEIKVRVQLFEKWLVNRGITKISGDHFTDEILRQAEIEKQKMFVSDSEIEAVVEGWSSYRGKSITSQNVRAWIEQVEDLKEQRVLFTILGNLKFVSRGTMRAQLNELHDSIKRELPEFVQNKRNQKRDDLFVVYVDGEGKSGQEIVSLYVDENNIPVGNIAESTMFSTNAIKYENSVGSTLNGIVVVDDFIGSGDSMSSNISSFLSSNEEFIAQRSLTVALVVIAATSEGKAKLEEFARDMCDFKLVVRVGMIVDDAMCFSVNGKLWGSENEQIFAANTVRKLGERLAKRTPLGYKGQGLALVFPDSCPNNSLPILHAKVKKDNFEWKPLFERVL